MTVQAFTVQRAARDARERRTEDQRIASFAAMSAKDLSCAWYALIYRQTDDAHGKAAVQRRMRALGVSDFDMAQLAHAGGLINSDVLRGYRK